ncbi:MAG: hypothetical protein IH598_00700 [Bacteroidales bacterium]|nr:hypothetical protein [Bacteroidales bacterium]
MTLKQLICSNQWDEVKDQLLKYYPDVIDAIQTYEELFYQLHFWKEYESDWKIFFEKREKNDFVDVKGKVEVISEDGTPETRYTIMEFTRWAVWLGCEIDPDTLKDYSEPQIIAHCMWEMTFMGWDEEEIGSKMDELAAILNTMSAEDQKPSEEV